MNAAAIITQADQNTEMEIQRSSSKGREMRSEFCMTAGIKTPNTDESRLQRRHFPGKMSSNIFFSDSRNENDNIPSGNTADRDDFFMPIPEADLKQFERRHFHVPSEDFIASENSSDVDEQIDSAGEIQSTENEASNTDPKETQRRHFGYKTNSNIFFIGLTQEEASQNNVQPFDFRKRKCSWNSDK